MKGFRFFMVDFRPHEAFIGLALWFSNEWLTPSNLKIRKNCSVTKIPEPSCMIIMWTIKAYSAPQTKHRIQSTGKTGRLIPNPSGLVQLSSYLIQYLLSMIFWFHLTEDVLNTPLLINDERSALSPHLLLTKAVLLTINAILINNAFFWISN